jgi:Ca2+-binding EF-hand superfamily protein
MTTADERPRQRVTPDWIALVESAFTTSTMRATMTVRQDRSCRFAMAVSLASLLALSGCSNPAPPQRAVADAATTPSAAAATVAPPRAASTGAAAVESALARLLRQLDRNGDGRVSRGEHADVARQMFDAMDADHDGKVTVAEMDAIRRDLYGPDRTAAARELAQVDDNHDGVLSAEEHAAATGVTFDQIDTDHDGFLTRAELQAAETAESAHKPR